MVLAQVVELKAAFQLVVSSNSTSLLIFPSPEIGSRNYMIRAQRKRISSKGMRPCSRFNEHGFESLGLNRASEVVWDVML